MSDQPTALPARNPRRRPLGDLNAAMRDLDADADHVRALLDEGYLLGFDISSRPKRKEIRVLTHSIEFYVENGKQLGLNWPEIFLLICPEDKLLLTGRELQRAMNCDQGHVASLIRAKHVEPASKSYRGRSGSPKIFKASFERFMKGRLL